MEQNMTANDYIKQAEQCEDFKEYATALKYYQKAFEMDSRQKTAEIGMERVKDILASQVFFQTEANARLVDGRLELRRGLLVFVGRNGADLSYQLSDMTNLRAALGRLTFDYEGESAPVGISCKSVKEWINVLEDAKNGKYPRLEEGGYSALEKYISDHFKKSNAEEAIDYCMQMSGVGHEDAKNLIERILG